MTDEIKNLIDDHIIGGNDVLGGDFVKFIKEKSIYESITGYRFDTITKEDFTSENESLNILTYHIFRCNICNEQFEDAESNCEDYYQFLKHMEHHFEIFNRKNLTESFDEIKKSVIELRDTQNILPCNDGFNCVCNDFDLILEAIKKLEGKFEND